MKDFFPESLGQKCERALYMAKYSIKHGNLQIYSEVC